MQPNYLWPLDVSTWIRDIIEDKNPKVQGRNSMLVTGPGNGYLEFPPLKSSAVLGSFTYKCLTDPNNCGYDDKHLTISFWVRLNSLNYGPSEEKFRFFGTDAVGIDFYFVAAKSENKVLLCV